MRSTFAVVALALAAGTACAQNQIVSDRPGTYVDISGLAGAQRLVNGVRADDVSYAFTSSVTNSVFASTNVRVCTNGYLQFGAATGATAWTNAAIAAGNVSPLAPTTAQALLPFWDDLLFDVGSTGDIYWIEGPAASFGLPASRGNVLIVQWKNVPHYNGGLTQGEGDFEVQIFQNVDSLVAAQILYNDVTFENAATMDGGVSATVGFAAGTTGGAGSISNVQWSFNTANAVSAGMVLSLLVPGGPLPPTGAGSAVADVASATLTVATSPGSNPASTGITVSGDLSAYGGSATTAFHDDGLNGDAAANDGTFTYVFAYPAGTGDNQAFTVPFTVRDAQNRSSGGNIAFIGPDLAGDLPATALVPAGSGELASVSGTLGNNDVDMFRINICDSGYFSATTVGSTTADTEMFIFDLSGMGVVMNDDSTGLQSTINTLIPSNGDYYIAVSRYDTDPTSGGAEIWLDQPFNSQRAPDGAGAGGAVDGWNGLGAGNTPYTIAFTGTCFPTNNTQCSPADVGVPGGSFGHDRLLNNNDFISFITLFFDQEAAADLGVAGGQNGHDNAWDNNDFIAFINYFFNDAAACNG